MTGGHITTEKLSRLKGGQGFGRERSLNATNSYYSRWDTNSNQPAPHAPHGGLFGLQDIIGNVRDLRSPQDSTQAPFRERFGSDNADRGLEKMSSLRDNKGNVGLLTPVAKLLKKARDLEDLEQISS